jgi:hypothetical protein
MFNPCLYHNKKSGVRTLVHGDDFVSVGKWKAVEEVKIKMQGVFEIKTNIVWRTMGCEQEGRVLNRVVRVSEGGWEYEPDQRHDEVIISDLGLSEAKEVTTPGEEEILLGDGGERNIHEPQRCD